MSQGPYDAGTQFLLDTMHDPRVPIWRRIECAKFLIESQPHEFNGRAQWVRDQRDDSVVVIKVVIGGFEPGAEQQPMKMGERRYEPNPARLN
jgi:hypothetical protein